MGWSPQVMTGDSLLTSVLALPHIDPDLLEGFLTIESYSHTLKKSKYRAKVTEVFKSLYDTRTSSYAAAGFDGMAILIDAMNRCQQEINSGCVNNRIRHTINFEGLMGKITISENGKAQRPLIVNRIQGQRLKLVVKVY